MKALAALALMAAPAALAQAPEAQHDELHFGISAGGGLSYDLAGARLEARGKHFGIYLGTGILGFNSTILGPYESSSGGCAGLFYLVGDGDGVMFSINGTTVAFSGHYDPGVQLSQAVSGSMSTLTATVGYRWRWGHVFIDAAIGGGLAWQSLPPSGYSGSPPPGTQNADSTNFIPDAQLGLGVEF